MKFNCLLILTALIAVNTKAAQANKDSLLIRNVHIVTANAQVSKQAANVLIEHERIRAIGKQEFNAEHVIDGKGQYLIPGLIDTHVHLRDVPGLTIPENERAQSKIYQEAAAQIPRSYLYSGFTTLFDLANTKAFIEQWNTQALAPEAFFCTPLIIPQGYPAVFLPKEIQDSPDMARHYLRDHHSHTTASTIDNDQTPAQLVDAGKKEGARCIKVFYERGFGAQRNLPVPSEAIVREVIATAHKQKLPVFLHGNSQEAYDFALNTGVDMLVHGLWNADAKTTTAELTDIAKRLAKAKIAVQPTCKLFTASRNYLTLIFFSNRMLNMQ